MGVKQVDTRDLPEGGIIGSASGVGADIAAECGADVAVGVLTQVGQVIFCTPDCMSSAVG